MPVITGDQLPKRLQDEVLRRYVYRWTKENLSQRPQVRKIVKATIPPISDKQWLYEHSFVVTKEGKLSANQTYARERSWADKQPNPSLSLPRNRWVKGKIKIDSKGVVQMQVGPGTALSGGGRKRNPGNKKTKAEVTYYRAVVRAGRGTLLGGVRTHTSMWTKDRKKAEDLLWVFTEQNQKAGRDIAESYVEKR